MIGKIVNGSLVRPTSNELRKIIIANPNEDILKYLMNYKDLIVDEEPEYDIDTQYLIEVYEETETSILIHWEIREISEELENIEE